MQLDRGFDKHLGRMVMRGTVRLIGGRVARMIITISGIAVLARLLTPADFGVVAVASMTLPLANALIEGLIDVPTIREDTLDRTGLANLIWVGVALMAGLTLVLWLAAPWLALWLNSAQLLEVLRIICFGLLLQPFIAASNALLRRQHRFGVSALFMPVSGAAYVMPAIVLASLGFGVSSLIFGQMASLVVTVTGLALISGIPLLPPRKLRFTVALRLGGLGLVTRMLNWLSANVDTLFASVALGAMGAGLYSRAYNITTQMKEPFAVLEQTVRQAFVAQRNLDDAAAARATLNGLRLVVLAAALVSAGVIVLREPMVALLLGDQWGAAVLPLAILVASMPARVARLYLDGFTYARGSMRHMLARNLIAVGVLTIGLWLWAANGVTAIALVVASVHLLRLCFTGGSVDVAIAGSLTRRMHAMLPGILAALLVVGTAEWASVIIDLPGNYGNYGLRLGIVLGAVSLVTLFVPRGWFPNSFQSRLPRVVGSLATTVEK